MLGPETDRREARRALADDCDVTPLAGRGASSGALNARDLDSQEASAPRSVRQTDAVGETAADVLRHLLTHSNT